MPKGKEEPMFDVYEEVDAPITKMIVGLVVLHLVSAAVFSKVKALSGKPHLMAHQLVCLVVNLWGCYFGLQAWFGGGVDGVKDRLYAFVPAAYVIGRVYDLFATVLMPDLRKAEMVVHHMVSVLLGYLLLRDRYCNYYSVFFMGLGEISTIPLVFVDVLKYVPQLASGAVMNGLRQAFALLFLSIRVVYWPFICCDFWYDNYTAYKGDGFHSNYVAGFFMVANITLTALQFFWGWLIVKAIVKHAKGSGGDKKDQ